MAGNRIKELRGNWVWYQSTGLLKGWKFFKYRKVGGTKWSDVITALPPEKLKEKLAAMTGMDVDVRAKLSPKAVSD